MNNNKVVKFKKRKRINIGIVVFLILFLYIAINVYIYFTKEQLSIYEVHEGSTAVDNQITGLILRNETVNTSDKAGYVAYYQKEGARVSKNSAVYTIDDSETMSDILADEEISISLSAKNSAELRREVKNFRNNYSNINYSYVYKFKDELDSTVMDLLTNTMIDNQELITEETGRTFSYDIVRSSESGIISYYTDGYEAVTSDLVTSDIFHPQEYAKTNLRTADIIDLNVPVYKLITSDEWKLVLLLTKDQYDLLAGKEQVTFTILEDGLRMTAPLALRQKGAEYYADITMNQYLSNYLEERYLDVQLDFDTVKGLKLPLSSVIEKDFYLVPLEYKTMGADSTDDGLIIEAYNEKTGEASYTFKPVDIYHEDDNYAYIDADLFAPGTNIHSSSGTKSYTLSQTAKLTGVYNVNQGYAVFRCIEILYQNEEYCIIKVDTRYGLSAYDQIALDGSVAIDQAIIY